MTRPLHRLPELTLVVVFLAAVFLVAILPTSPAGAEELTVVITSPAPGVPVFGEVTLAADVLGRPAEDIARAEFFADDVFLGARDAPPWRLDWDASEENVEHRLEVVVEARDGARASALLVTRAIAVDLETDAALQQLYVTARRRGEPLLDLRREDFRVLDDGAAQRLVTFERGDVPLTASLVIDSSESMRGGRLEAALAGAGAFVDGMQRLDQAQLLLFSDRVLHETPFTSVAEVLRAGLSGPGGLEAEGGTALVDHLYLALRRLETHQGRRVIVLLSDGVDVSSLLRMEEAAAALRRSQVMLFWLRLGGDVASHQVLSPWHDAEGHRRQLEALTRAVERSGGRVVDLRSVDDAGEAFAGILGELRSQYVLGYYPSRDLGDGSWHAVEVEVSRRGVEVRTREGYVDR